MLLRFILGGLFAITFVFSIFWLLQSIISSGANQGVKQETAQLVDVVRLKKESEIMKKERVKPKKPEPKKQPPKPKVNMSVNQAITLGALDLNLELDLSANSALGDTSISFGRRAISTGVIPISRVSPVYPRRAKSRGTEGFVKLEFTITSLGTVKDITVLESQPEGIFESAAKRALLKWKFRPKLEGGVAIEQRAMLQIDFELDK